MKARTYKDLEKHIRAETKKQIAEYEYQLQEVFLDNAFRAALAAAVAVFHRRGRSAAYIKRFAEDFQCLLDTPPLYGMTVTDADLIERFAAEYGVAFDEIHVGRESREEFFKRQGVRL